MNKCTITNNNNFYLSSNKHTNIKHCKNIELAFNQQKLRLAAAFITVAIINNG